MRAVRRLHAAGLTASAIARRTGIPRSTVRDWLARPAYVPGAAFRARRPSLESSGLPPRAYAYLLGLYLGDGHIVASARSYRLTITLDALYPAIVRSAALALAAVTGTRVAVTRHRVHRCVTVTAYSSLWPELLPQHGPGRKHERWIGLEPWQLAITRPEAAALVRGLIHSDGCRYTASVRRHGREYRYVRYSFSNRSDDIKRIFCEHLDLLGVPWTRPNGKDIAVARRAGVAVLDRLVGPKR